MATKEPRHRTYSNVYHIRDDCSSWVSASNSGTGDLRICFDCLMLLIRELGRALPGD